MNDPTSAPRFDPSSAQVRRRLYLSRALRKKTHGSGSDLTRLLDAPPRNRIQMTLLDTLRVMLVGAHAAAAYAPERATSDIDFLVHPEDLREAEARLLTAGWKKTVDLTFAGTNLGLRGSAWAHGADPEIDLITSDQPWLIDAFDANRVESTSGKRVIPRAYLILMKLDSARGVDQGDLTRILGRLTDPEIEDVVRIVERHDNDHAIADEIRQYAQIGRWEYDSSPKPKGI